jgi:hypothetical protein
MTEHEELQEKALVLLNKKLSILNENASDLFKGNVYKDKTKVSGGRLKANILSIGRQLAQKFDVYPPLFIVGYELENSSLFFEVWYLPIDGAYIVVDKFGKRIEKNQKYQTMDRAINELVDIVTMLDAGEEEDEKYYQSMDKELESQAERRLRRKYKTRSSKLDRDDLSDVSVEGKILLDIPLLLEQSVASKKILFDLINNDIKEYNTTRMNRSKVSSIWGVILGKNIKTPTKYIGGIDKLFTLTGTNKEATFVVGYSLDDKINIEIWFVKNVVSGRGEFFVFDITAGQLIAKGLKNMRQAYSKIANKIVLKVD